eukprot:CAMPEP_0198289318 /NCGR_PEP_ID=MMETSP1449-20131203/7544_1 /TAXON_ID=420275 /ORGANISM="Attheya septentrionalis, Strain CCMP2084" /LENGTH=264 /DNA_ID=CAMNT_0043987627 /DNA_START=116 /DNA_END=910 /DNA_ORIENTATION=+
MAVHNFATGLVLRCSRAIAVILVLLPGAHAWLVGSPVQTTLTHGWAARHHPNKGVKTTSMTTTCRKMGLLDNMLDKFLGNRENDFEKIDKADPAFGPGPILLMYFVPSGITTEEVYDILADGAPLACRQSLGVQVARINSSTSQLLDQSVSDALNQIVLNQEESDGAPKTIELTQITPIGATTTSTCGEESGRCPVLYFSGFGNEEMMATYNILGAEIYQETGDTVACAKAVPNAMNKSLQQVLEEISGDHADAMKLMRDENTA